MMRLEQIDHVALRCASVEATREWYISVLGFEPAYVEEPTKIPVFLRLGSTYITLFPQKGNEQASGRVWHVALRARTQSDLQQAQTELQKKGIPFEFRDHEMSHSLYFRDPDGVLLEITTYDVPGKTRHKT
jgi:catechol-2,3-dioxygenase